MCNNVSFYVTVWDVVKDVFKIKEMIITNFKTIRYLKKSEKI